MAETKPVKRFYTMNDTVAIPVGAKTVDSFSSASSLCSVNNNNQNQNQNENENEIGKENNSPHNNSICPNTNSQQRSSRLSLDLFRQLTTAKDLPQIDASVAVTLVDLECCLMLQQADKTAKKNKSLLRTATIFQRYTGLQKRCVSAIVRDWTGFTRSYNETDQNIMDALQSLPPHAFEDVMLGNDPLGNNDDPVVEDMDNVKSSEDDGDAVDTHLRGDGDDDDDGDGDDYGDVERVDTDDNNNDEDGCVVETDRDSFVHIVVIPTPPSPENSPNKKRNNNDDDGNGNGNNENTTEFPMTISAKRFFRAWFWFRYLILAFNLANVEWQNLFRASINQWLYMLVLLFLQHFLLSSASELPLMAVTTMLVEHKDDEDGVDGGHLGVIINYNLLASDEEEVDAALDNQYHAYVNNLRPSVMACLVSATGDQVLKDYEMTKRDSLRTDVETNVVERGSAWLEENGLQKNNNTGQRQFFLEYLLPMLAKRYAANFLVVQRVTRVLRKCGQYQDLMLLSEEGDNFAWSYTDAKYYSEKARTYGDNLFYPSADVDMVQGKKFAYTLVLDGDSRLEPGSLKKLMDIAASNPTRPIIQPAIKLFAYKHHSVLMHIEVLRQKIYAPLSKKVSLCHGRSGFFGKALINNKLYIDKMLGTRDAPIERVPIEVLSHDTYEAAVLAPLFVSSVQLLEEPCATYVTWDIRETRWNRGELILAHHFHKLIFDKPVTWAMNKCREVPPPKLKLRTETEFNESSSLIAHSALRQMILKPVLLVYCLGSVFTIQTFLYFPWVPLLVIMFGLLVFPKIAVWKSGFWNLTVETLCAFFQYTPEPIMGTIRVLKSFHIHISGKSSWIPQFKVEKDFAEKPPFIASMYYQWKILLGSVILLGLVCIFEMNSWPLVLFICTAALLPIFTTLTALPFSEVVEALDRTTRYLCKIIRRDCERHVVEDNNRNEVVD